MTRKWIGRLISLLDTRLNRDANRRGKGVLALVVLLAVTGLVAAALAWLVKPILDDVLSELDAERAAALLHHLPPGQVVLTTAAALPAAAAPDARHPRDRRHPDDGEQDQREDDPTRSRHASNTALVPGLTISDSRAASQLVIRTQPWLAVRPIFCGSGVPWIP